ncbi:MAG: hypothetical protein JWN52_7833 [Actinomycetia bacterium]|nr:hypothetical protein [Actinomycetes bacterium]
MMPSEIRYALLVHLAWELRTIPVSSWLVVPYCAEPVLYVAGGNGRKDAILAVQRNGGWWLLWRGAELDGRQLGIAARHIATAVAA